VSVSECECECGCGRDGVGGTFQFTIDQGGRDKEFVIAALCPDDTQEL